MSLNETQRCEKCTDVIWFSAHCGAWVCESCSHHNGLARCYCGWASDGGNGRKQLAERGENVDEPEDAVYYSEEQAKEKFTARMNRLDQRAQRGIDW